MVIFGGKEGEGKKKFINDVHVLDMTNFQWEGPLVIEGIPPEARMGHSAQIYEQNKIIIYGGWNEKVLDDIFILQMDNNSPTKLFWSNCKIINTPKRQFHTANILDQKMYVFGGGDGKFWLNDLYCLDIKKQQWVLLQNNGEVPVERLQHSSILYDRKIYIFGGEPDRQRQLNDLYCYNIDQNLWIELHPTGISPSPRVSVSSCLVKNKIYFFGGYDGASWKNDLYSFNIDENKWEYVETQGLPPKQRCRHSAIQYNDKIYIFGGNDSEKSYSDLHILKMQIQIQIEESTIIQDFGNLINDTNFTDVIFQVENEEFPAHKAILSTRCEQFKAMFTSQLAESHYKKIRIDDVKASTFKMLLEYIYKDKVDLTVDIAIELLELADKYLLTRLKNLCEQYLAQNLNKQNVINIINLAETHDAQCLKNYALMYVVQNKQHILESQENEIKNLSKEILVELLKLKK